MLSKTYEENTVKKFAKQKDVKIKSKNHKEESVETEAKT